VSAQDNPPKIEELYERLQRAEAAARRAGRGGIALRIVFFLTWVYVLWSCRDGCSELSWFLRHLRQYSRMARLRTDQ